MSSVIELVQDPVRRHAMIDDGVVELEAELAERSGVTAMAMRAGYKALRKLRPNMVESNLDRLLPMWAPALDPYVAAGRASGDLPAHFRANADEIAEALLGATDLRAREAQNKVATKAYAKLRPRAKDQVILGMPRVGRLVDRHVP
ncbi:MAG: hypothetical protein GEV08_25355 [Acidimicrobiia bacterium]|nr:hypothetical protein [Acidimicrobiia bacterium]